MKTLIEKLSSVPNSIVYGLILLLFAIYVTISTNRITELYAITQTKAFDRVVTDTSPEIDSEPDESIAHHIDSIRKLNDSLISRTKADKSLVVDLRRQITMLNNKIGKCICDEDKPPRPKATLERRLRFGKASADTLFIKLNCKPDKYGEVPYEFELKLINGFDRVLMPKSIAYEPHESSEMLIVKFLNDNYGKLVEKGESFSISIRIYDFEVDDVEAMKPTMILSGVFEDQTQWQAHLKIFIEK